MFDADVDPTFDAERAVDEDKERRLDDKQNLWFKESFAERDRDERILERRGGGDDGGGGDGNGSDGGKGTLRLQWIEVPSVLEIYISR